MAVVTLRAPLKERAGGTAKHDLPGDTVGAVLQELERRHPRIQGWILDDQGHIRSHVNVFVNGEKTKEEGAVGTDDTVQVLPSISGGSR